MARQLSPPAMGAPGPATGPNRLVLLGYPYTPAADTGRGIDHYLYYLAAGYRRRGVEFDVVENGRFADHINQLVWGEPQIYARVGRHRRGFWHAVSPVGGRVAAMLGRHPLVTTVHDVMPFYLRQRHPARYRFLRFCIEVACRGSDRVIVTFPSVRQFLVERLGIPESRISLVPVGVDPGILGVTRDDRPPPSVRPSETVLFLGSWNPIDRGGDLALRAMKELLRARPSARLLFSARGPQNDALRRLATELGIERSVSFVGFIPEEQLGATLRSAAAFVAPSRLGYTISVMHAMYAGVPVIVTDVRDQGYFVGDAGIVCPPDDPAALGDALARVLGDERLRSELAERGWFRVLQFSSERMVEETLRAYAEAGWSPSA
jgi:glycosyltransferase involved in cell wall biosynthesis